MFTDKYPKIIYKNVLLVNNKIVNWKIGSACWNEVYTAFSNRQPMWILKHKSTTTTAIASKLVHNTVENNEFFTDTEWFKQWKLHEKFSGFKPY